MKIISIFGGPGVGKTTTAEELSAKLKRKHISCEYVSEFAKGLTFDKSFGQLENQIYVFGNQHHWLLRASAHKPDYIITDAPLFNSIVYSGKGEDHKHFHNHVMHEFNRYENINIYIDREIEYKQEGRYQDLEGAKKVDAEILRCFEVFNVPFHKVGIENSVEEIMRLI